ncbi:MAG: hypothetical protein ACXWML_08525 [Candidatus Binataceae bacterium]
MATFRFSLAVAVAAAALLLNAPAQARSAKPFPRIVDAIDAKTCRQALMVATRAFQSTAPKLAGAAPAILQDGKPAFGILLAPNGSSGDEQGYIVDEQAIAQSEETGDFKEVLLQKTPADGFRFVVTQEKMNWQADWHALFLADATLEREKFAAVLAEAKKDARTDGVKVVFKDAWQQPWLVRDLQTSQVVAIDTQHPADFLARWTVYAAVKDAAVPACRIAFGPPAKDATRLLPAGPLRQLAVLLDAIVGIPSQSEGTFNASGRNRVAAANGWMNLVLRPWAMPEPYNTAAEVEAGLKRWSKGHAVYRAEYRRFHVLYPKALRALASHYRVTLKKSPRESAALAKRSLDRAIGMHFTFAKAG